MNILYLQSSRGERVEFYVTDDEHFSIQYGNEYAVELTKEDAQELLGFLSQFVDGEI